MRILILGLNFHPELTGIGKYTGELASYLVQTGHQVRAVTAPPYYPQWKVLPGYRRWWYQREEWHGVHVYRSPLWVPGSLSGSKRLLHLLSFAASSFPVMLGQVSWRPHVVFCIAPTLFSAPSGLLVARLCRAKAWLHIQDFELDAATSLDLLSREGVLTRLAARLESWLMARFDRVTSLSKRMLVRLKEKGVHTRKAGLFPNWVDTNLIHPLTDSHDGLCQMFQLPEDKTIVLYSGNMGQKQGLELVVEAARQLRTSGHIHFVFCGDGVARSALEGEIAGLNNVQFLPLQPLERLNQLLNVADIHILPQRGGAADLVMPSKLLGMMASGKAVLATAAPDTEVGEVVAQVGVLVPPDSCEPLCASIRSLADSARMRQQYGKAGRALVCEHWDADRVLSTFQEQLIHLVSDDSLDR